MSTFVGSVYVAEKEHALQMLQNTSNLVMRYVGNHEITLNQRVDELPVVAPLYDTGDTDDVRICVFPIDESIDLEDAAEYIQGGALAADTGYFIHILMDTTLQYIRPWCVPDGTAISPPAGWPYATPPLRYICCNVDVEGTNDGIVPFSDVGDGLTIYHACQTYLQVMSANAVVGREAIPLVTTAVARKAQCPTTAVAVKMLVTASNVNANASDFGLYMDNACATPTYQQPNINNNVLGEAEYVEILFDWPIRADLDPDTALYKEWTNGVPGAPSVDAHVMGFWLPNW